MSSTLYARYCEAKKIGEDKIMVRKAINEVENLLANLKYDGSDESVFTALVEEIKKLRELQKEKIKKYSCIRQEVGLNFINSLYND